MRGSDAGVLGDASRLEAAPGRGGSAPLPWYLACSHRHLRRQITWIPGPNCADPRISRLSLPCDGDFVRLISPDGLKEATR